jgi:hypothetical protein
METEALIETLVRDAGNIRRSVEERLAIFAAAGFVITGAVFAWTLGPRADLADALSTPAFQIKLVLAILLAATLFLPVAAAARPGSRPRLHLVWVVPVLLALCVIAELAFNDTAEWRALAIGSNGLVCLTALPMLSLIPLSCLLAAMRQAAATRPIRAGALAGVLAGSIGAVLYATHCTDDSPLFVATWYSLAIGIVAAIGAAAGRFLLRW